jgi:hypothetical protein
MANHPFMNSEGINHLSINDCFWIRFHPLIIKRATGEQVRLKIRLKFEDTKILKNSPKFTCQSAQTCFIFFLKFHRKVKDAIGIDFLRLNLIVCRKMLIDARLPDFPRQKNQFSTNSALFPRNTEIQKQSRQARGMGNRLASGISAEETADTDNISSRAEIN